MPYADMPSSLSKSSGSQVCIIIPVHNRKPCTLQCLASLKLSGDLTNFSVIVVDDGSTDGTAEAVRHEYPQVKLLRGDGGLWWTGAIKLGMQDAIARNFDFIVWLNDDCLVDSNTINELVTFAHKNAQSIVGGIGYDSDCPTKLSFGGKVRTIRNYQLIEPSARKVHSCDLLSGNLVCIPATVVHKIGYPDVDKTPHYGGDSLFLIRARQAGYSLFFDNRWPATNLSTDEKSSTSSDSWFTGNRSTLEIFNQIFNRHSLMSWRVLWVLYTEDHHAYGIVLFYFKFSRLVVVLACITVLRWLPTGTRRKLSLIKRGVFAS